MSALLVMTGALAYTFPAAAATTPVGLGTAQSYSVLGGQTVTNTGPTTLSGDLGLSPGTAITGFPPGIVGGSTHAGDAPAAQAQSDLVTAYNDTAGRVPTASISGDLVGQTLSDGVYASTGPIALSGTLTLDAHGDPDAVFILQTTSTLITAASSRVDLVNGAQSCNVYWQVGSSATLGTTSTFVGTILAMESITVTTGAHVEGRALARKGSVTLDGNTFAEASCSTAVTPPSTGAPTDTPTETPTGQPTAAPTDLPTASPTAAPTDLPTASPTAAPAQAPTASPTYAPAQAPAAAPTDVSTEVPTAAPTDASTEVPTGQPTVAPTELAATGAGNFLSLLLGFGALLIIFGGALMGVRRARSTSTH